MADNHIIVAGYAAGGYTKTRPAFQYDYGQELQLQGFPEGMLPASFEMHFSIGMGQAITRIGTNGAVAVPNACLERFGTLTAWLFLHDTESDGETKYVIEIPVRSKSKTTDQEPMPEEQSVITETIAALRTGVTAAEAAQEAAEAAAESVGEAAEQAQGKAGEAAASATAAAESAEAAAGSATSAAGAATSAGESASAAAGSATAASGSAEAAAGSATAAAGSAAAAAQTVAGIEEAGAAQVLAVNTAGAAKVDAINTAGTEKVNAINTAGTEKVNAVNTAGAAQVQAVEAKGEEVIEEIPADYSALSADVTNLKSAMDHRELSTFLVNDSSSMFAKKATGQNGSTAVLLDATKTIAIYPWMDCNKIGKKVRISIASGYKYRFNQRTAAKAYTPSYKTAWETTKKTITIENDAAEFTLEIKEVADTTNISVDDFDKASMYSIGEIEWLKNYVDTELAEEDAERSQFITEVNEEIASVNNQLDAYQAELMEAINEEISNRNDSENDINDAIDQLESDVSGKLDKPSTDGTEGQIATNNGRGGIRWSNVGLPTNEQTAAAVTAWLNNHPEATTTVQDGSLTLNKFVVGALNYLTPEMYGAVGDGITDDTEALQSMIADTDDCPFVMLFPGKTYLLTPTSEINGILLRISNGITLIGNGAKIKIADNTPGYTAIIGSASDDLTGLYIENVVFDHNAENTDNFENGSGTTVLTKARMTVYVKRGSRFTFVHNTILNADSTNSIVYNGDGNTENCFISENLIKDIGINPNHLYHDHSTVYATGDNIIISNNCFIGKSWGAEGTTCAIEVHPGKNCNISNNIISKYHSAINYAGVYEHDSVNGIINGNNIETLRHGIILFGSSYLTHTTGYSIDGLIVSSNIVRIRNAIGIGNITGGVVGVGGIVFYSSFSLPVKNVDVCGNRIVFDVETDEPEYSAYFGAIGIFETTNQTAYENVVFRDIYICNAPIRTLVMGDGNGVLVNCKAENIVCTNPYATQRTGINYAYKRGVSIAPKEIQTALRIDVRFLNADKNQLVRPFAISSTADSTSADVLLIGRIDWTDAPADSSDTYELLTTYNANILPMLKMIVNTGSVKTLRDYSPYGSAVIKKGSIIYKKTGTAYVATEDGNTLTSVTPSSALEQMVVNALIN